MPPTPATLPRPLPVAPGPSKYTNFDSEQQRSVLSDCFKTPFFFFFLKEKSQIGWAEAKMLWAEIVLAAS